MSKRENIDNILKSWPYKPGMVMARRAKGRDGRDVVQMRVEMGLLQMEVENRPDGERPEGFDSYYDYLLSVELHEGDDLVLSEEQCDEIDREFVQFYHRRVCWLALREFGFAQRDANHTLRLMDFATQHAPDEQWALSHEQYRPFVMFHRVQAAALAFLEEDDAENAVEEIDQGLAWFEKLFSKHDAEDAFQDDELVARLRELKESIQEHYELDSTLVDQLAQAVAAEEYERAAQIRDEIQRRKQQGQGNT